MNSWLRGSGAVLMLAEIAACNAVQQTSQCLAASHAVRDATADVHREVAANPSATPEIYARIAVRYQALQSELLSLKPDRAAKAADTSKAEDPKAEAATPKPPESQFSKLVGRLARDVAALASEADEYAALLRQQRESKDASVKSQTDHELQALRGRRERTEDAYGGSLEKLGSFCKTGR